MSNATPPHAFTAGQTASAQEVNENFQEIYEKAVDATGDTLTGTLTTQTLAPSANNTYDLGDVTHAYRNVYVSGAIVGAGAPGNTFGTIAVSGQSDVVADATNDTLTLAAGTGVTITTNATTDTVTISAASAAISGTDNHVVRVDGTSAFQSSALVIDDSGNLTGVNDITATGAVVGGISSSLVALSAGNNNNLSLGDVTTVLIDATAGTCTITGLTGGVGGRIVHLVNMGSSGTFALSGEDVLSTAANRFATSSTTIGSGVMLTLVYVAGSVSRWVRSN